MDAQFLAVIEDHRGNEVGRAFFAFHAADTWPGYDRSLPLGRKGVWYGTEGCHTHLGAGEAGRRELQNIASQAGMTLRF